MLPICLLIAVSSSLASDHCPMPLTGETNMKKYRGFRFESFWPKVRGFQEEVAQVGSRPVNLHSPFLRLHTKPKCTEKRLRAWARGKK